MRNDSKLLLLAMVTMMALTSLVACHPTPNEPSSQVDYNHVADVSLFGWQGGDTLFFPVEVTSPARTQTPLHKGMPYGISCSIRMEGGYRLTDVPMSLIVQQTDTVAGGHLHVVRNLLREEIAPVVRDSLGNALGSSWGSLVDYQTPLPGLTVTFDSVGTYRMLLIPRTGQLSSFRGISAVGLQLNRKF